MMPQKTSYEAFPIITNPADMCWASTGGKQIKTHHMSCCGSAGRAGQLAIGRSLVKILAKLSCMSKCPWVRHWTPTCAPEVQLAPCTMAASTVSEDPVMSWRLVLPSPRDSWDWLQQKTQRPHIRVSGYRRWMENSFGAITHNSYYNYDNILH